MTEELRFSIELGELMKEGMQTDFWNHFERLAREKLPRYQSPLVLDGKPITDLAKANFDKGVQWGILLVAGIPHQCIKDAEAARDKLKALGPEGKDL